MSEQPHWDKIYRENAPDDVSWYRPHLETSLNLIDRVAPARSASIIDVGGGESTLVDDLLGRGYGNVTVLDLSPIAIEVTKKRLGEAAQGVRWLAANVTEVDLAPQAYDVWHDRAVFHFLTENEARSAYVRQVGRAVRRGGNVIVGTFGPQGPQKCSGLDVVRYDAKSLRDEFGAKFELLESRSEVHTTPWHTTQQFVYCLCRVE
jgi:2-polyprenyl-3-methyl-5-hydroxy-6-metoxy-1,4-benzoquinol methylase